MGIRGQLHRWLFKNNVKHHIDEEIAKLNSRVSWLEQRLLDYHHNRRDSIDKLVDYLAVAMNDDDLITQAAIRNAELVKEIANRSKIRKKVLSFYKGLI